MAVYFEGVSTGNRYEVGRSYESAGRTYTAQADGSFAVASQRPVYDSTGGFVAVAEGPADRFTKGSYGDPNVSWFASGSDSLSHSYHSPGAAVSATGSDGSPAAVGPRWSDAAGSQESLVRMSSPAARSGGSISLVRDAAWSGKKDPPQDLLIAGYHMRANPAMSNADLAEARYSDIGGNIIGTAVLGSDLGDNLARMMGPGYWGTGEKGPELARHRLNYMADAVADWSAVGIASEFREGPPAQPLKHDGWTSHDGGNSWEYTGIVPAYMDDPKRVQYMYDPFPGTN